jgi:hypothetical protein
MSGTATGRGDFEVRRLLPPAVLALAVVTAAPFLGQLRNLLFERLPPQVVGFGTAVFAVLVAAAFVTALARIRQRRWLRYGGLALALALVWLQVVGLATGIPEVDVVERVHVLEFGMLALLFYRAFRPLSGAAAGLGAFLATLLAGILDEWLQWFVASRVGEAGDVGLNAAAAATGVVFALSLWPPLGRPWRPAPAERRALVALAVVVVLGFGGFYHCAHLGYLVRDEPEGLVFRSWYSPQELPAVAAERARRWAAGDLPSLDPLDHEDYFFVEGTSHVAHRNASLTAGDARTAWKEQRILERYYAPVLEQRGLHSGEALDLEPAHREDLRRQAGRLGGRAYSSPVLADRIILTPSKPAWWTGVGTAVAALLLAAVAGARPGAGRR